MAILNKQQHRKHVLGWTIYYLFELTYRDFVLRSEGARGRFSKKWTPLSPRTRAYKPLRRGESKEYGVRRYKDGKGILTPKLTNIWRGIYAKQLARGADPAEAARIAWGVVKRRGGRTLLDQLSDRNVPINVRTGALQESLRPGFVGPDGSYQPTQNQLVELRGKSIKVDVALPYFQFVNAVRPIWPSNQAQLLREAERLARAEVKARHEIRTRRNTKPLTKLNPRVVYPGGKTNKRHTGNSNRKTNSNRR